VTSPYPVVLSIENHCCLEQQKVLAKIMIDVFKDKLAMPLKNADGSFVTSLPSPMELKHKILIKGKRLASHGAEAEEVEDDPDDEDDAATTTTGDKDDKNAPKNKKKHNDTKVLICCCFLSSFNALSLCVILLFPLFMLASPDTSCLF